MDKEMRFEFGKNWEDFVKRHFDESKVEVAQTHMLEFLGLDDLTGKSFLDIGCGSGLHSYAAWRSGADRIVGFDYDENSVSASRMLRRYAGEPENWTISSGSVLDEAFMDSLGDFEIVYSWGVLHHTGEQWRALRNAARCRKPDGKMYIALYTSDAFVDPPPEFWLDVKRRYNESSWAGKRIMEAWYVWRFEAGWSPAAWWRLLRKIYDYNKNRGMSYFTDVRDWLGGWPMEFSSIAEVKAFVRDELGLEVSKLAAGHANTEYLIEPAAR